MRLGYHALVRLAIRAGAEVLDIDRDGGDRNSGAQTWRTRCF